MSPVRKTAKRRTLKRTGPASPARALPHLSSFLSGYLHEDFLLDYDAPGAALAGFLAECSPAERRGLARDWRTFVVATEGRPWPVVRAAFTALGGAWRPSSKAALDQLFSVLSV
jgi:hypothetical protein